MVVKHKEQSMSKKPHVVHSDHLDFTDDHIRLGLKVPGRQWGGLTPGECAELALRLDGTSSPALRNLADYMKCAAFWGNEHPEALEGFKEVSA